MRAVPARLPATPASAADAPARLRTSQVRPLTDALQRAADSLAAIDDPLLGTAVGLTLWGMRGATTPPQPSVAQHLSSLAFLMERIKHAPLDGKLGLASSWTGMREHARRGGGQTCLTLRHPLFCVLVGCGPVATGAAYLRPVHTLLAALADAVASPRVSPALPAASTGSPPLAAAAVARPLPVASLYTAVADLAAALGLRAAPDGAMTLANARPGGAGGATTTVVAPPPAEVHVDALRLVATVLTHLAALLRTNPRGVCVSRCASKLNMHAMTQRHTKDRSLTGRGCGSCANRRGSYALEQHRHYVRALQQLLAFPELLPVRALQYADLTTFPLGTVLEAPTAAKPLVAEDPTTGSRLSPEAQYAQRGRRGVVKKVARPDSLSGRVVPTRVFVAPGKPCARCAPSWCGGWSSSTWTRRGPCARRGSWTRSKS